MLLYLIYPPDIAVQHHDDVIKWKHFPCYWPLVRESTSHHGFPSGDWWIPLTKSTDAGFDIFFDLKPLSHYNDIIMGSSASQITSLTIVYSSVYSGADQKILKFRVTALCAETSMGTVEFPAQMVSNAESVSIWWRHHVNQCWRDSLTHKCGTKGGWVLNIYKRVTASCSHGLGR